MYCTGIANNTHRTHPRRKKQVELKTKLLRKNTHFGRIKCELKK